MAIWQLLSLDKGAASAIFHDVNKVGTICSLQMPEGLGRPEARYCRCVLVAVPPGGLGAQFPRMRAWLDAACGPETWSWAPAGRDGVVNDAIAFYFVQAGHAAAFIGRFCCAYRR